MKEFSEALLSECRNPNIPEEHDLFARMIGDWNFEWRDGFGSDGPRRVQGEWLFRRVLDGMGVQDIFICPSRATRILDVQPDAEYGSTLRIYNPQTEAWDVFYGCPKTAIRLEARCDHDMIVLTEVTEGKIKFIFCDITDHSFNWRRIETDDGTTWRVAGELTAKRKR